MERAETAEGKQRVEEAHTRGRDEAKRWFAGEATASLTLLIDDLNVYLKELVESGELVDAPEVIAAYPGGWVQRMRELAEEKGLN